jgi:flagellar protein FlaG
MQIPDLALTPPPLRDPSAPAAGNRAPGVANPSGDGISPSDPTFAAQTDKAVGEINKTLHLSAVGVRFEVDPQTDRMIAKVVDADTGEVIRQMPSEVAIRISKALDKLQGLLLNEQG